jgi:hypothetical protein
MHALHIFSSLVAVLLFIAYPCLSHGIQAPPKASGLSLSAEPSPVAVGGTVRLILRYSLPPGAGLGSDPEIKGIEDLSVAGKEVGEGRIVLTVIADSLDPIRTGPIELGFVDKAGRKGYLRSEGIEVKVVSNIKGGADSEDLSPIQGIIPLANPWIRWAVIIGTVLLAAAALGGVILALKRRRKGPSSEAPADPPHIRAERDIEALLRENLFEKGEQKEFYFRFTEIVKRYIEAIRGFPAAEFTTEEIAQRAAEQDRPALNVLRYADLVKFADEIATPGRKEEDVSCILAYINVTAPTTKGEEGPEKDKGGTA